MVYTSTADPDPTQEFDEYCVNVLRRWERGELPFNEAIALITVKEQEAIAQNHLANQGRAHHLLGYLQHYRGNLNASIRHYDRARTLFQRVNNPQRLAVMDMNNGENYRLKGDFNRARRLYRAAYEVARQFENIMVQTMASVNEGLALLAVGQYGSAHKLLMQGYELTSQWTERLETLPGLLCEIHHGLAVIYLEEGKIEAAWQEAQHALVNAQKANEAMRLGFAYRTLGEVLAAMDSPPAGEEIQDPDHYFRSAIQAFREMNMEAEMARTIFAQARTLARRGRRTTAARKLQQVMIMFTELGMVDDAAKAAEAQLAVL